MGCPGCVRRRSARAPRCGRFDAVVPILYGDPSAEAMEAAERDEIVLAGCTVRDVDPNYYYRRCLIAFEFARQFA